VHIGVKSVNDVPYNLDEADVCARLVGWRRGRDLHALLAGDLGSGQRTGRDLVQDAEAAEWSGDSWQHVAIGTDFDGFTDPPDDCDSEAQLPVIREMLADKGLSTEEADAVLEGNARRVLRSAWR
jgi:hypothetical protein